jgi:hypothetical protein
VLHPGHHFLDTPLVVPAGTRLRLLGSRHVDGLASTMDGKGRTRLWEVSGQLEIDGLQLTRGQADLGGAILVHPTGALRVSNSVITDCHASSSSVPDDAGGGAVFSRFGSVTLVNTTLTRCSASSSAGGMAIGGALAIYGGRMSVRDASFSFCTSSASGAGNARGNTHREPGHHCRCHV